MGILRWGVALGATLTLFSLSSPARATSLPPGSSVIPSLGTETGTLVTSTSGTFAPTVGTSPTGTYHEAVFREIGGTLDFVFQLKITKGVLESLSTAGFAKYGVSVITQKTGTAPLGGFVTGSSLLLPPNATRTGTKVDGGDVVRFNYPSSKPVGKNQTTAILIIRTDAKQFVAGAIGFQDGGGASAHGFQPRRFGAPEPASVLLLAGLSVGVVGRGLRQRLRASPTATG